MRDYECEQCGNATTSGTIARYQGTIFVILTARGYDLSPKNDLSGNLIAISERIPSLLGALRSAVLGNGMPH